MNIANQLTAIVDIEVDGIDTRDYPDFCDAFIASAAIETRDGEYRELIDEELDYINDNCPDFVYEAVQNQLY